MGIFKEKALKKKDTKRNPQKIVKHERPPEFKGRSKRIKVRLTIWAQGSFVVRPVV